MPQPQSSLSASLFRPIDLLAIGLGGALGSLLRTGITMDYDGLFPLPTLAVNLLGTLLLALLHVRQHHLPPQRRYLYGVGFCGSLTTTSLFSLQTVQLCLNGHPTFAAAYLLLSLAPAFLMASLLLHFLQSPHDSP